MGVDEAEGLAVNADIVNLVMMLFSLAASALLGVVLRGIDKLRSEVSELGKQVARLEGQMSGKPGDRRTGLRDQQ